MFAPRYWLARITSCGLGPGYGVAISLERWFPSRSCHKSALPWSRDAVMAVLLVAQRGRRLAGVDSSDGNSWFEQVPILPREIWQTIIGLVPFHALGRPPGWTAAPDACVEEWLTRQITLSAVGGWKHSAEIDALRAERAILLNQTAAMEKLVAEQAAVIAMLRDQIGTGGRRLV